MSMGRRGLIGNPRGMPWEDEIERQRQRIEAEMEQGAPQQQVPAGGLLGQQQPQQGFWQGGEKFRARDGIAGLLAVIGDAIAANRGSGSMGATQNLMGGRMDAMEEAKKRAKEQEQLQAAYGTADRLGVPRDTVDAKRLGVPLPEKRKPHVFEDNAGNLMEYDFETGQARPLSIDPADRTYFNNGAMVTVPNPRRNMGPTHTIGGENLPIPRLGLPTAEEAMAELRRRRGY